MNFRCTLGASLLVTGTSVGAGMLALPVVTASGGFIPAIAVFLLCWFVMTATGLLYLEICLKMPPNTNIISMAHKYLGNQGRIFAWIIYLFLFYCLSVAYISGGVSFIHSVTANALSDPIVILFFVTITAFFVYQGAKMVDKINILLMLGLVISYLFFVVLGFKYIQPQLLTNMQWSKAYISLPIILVSFGYQGLIPSLSDYLGKDVKSLRIAIILGTSLTFVIYFLWEFLILGIAPLEGEHGLLMANLKGQSALAPLSHLTKAESVHKIGQFFSFFAITTSFLGVSLGLFDFISDGLSLAKRGWKKIIIAILTFFPPTIIALVNPNLFLIALDYAGGIGGSLLLVLLPALLIWQARYVKKIKTSSIAYGGKGLLFFIYVFVFIVVAINLYQQYLRF
jgi:tyrosine-specific transport protein